MLSSLTMLLPFAGDTIFSKGMAFEDYGYEEADQYEQYAKSQGNDFVKKIKCNNISSNINGDNNSINFGSSSGVGAESIQDDASVDTYGYDKRNNGSFDLDCINNNEGGIPGPEGPQGPPGITTLDSHNIYRVNATDDGADGQILLDADCDSGDFVIEAGYDTFEVGIFDRFEVRENSPNAFGDSYRVSILVNEDADNFGDLIVFCFDNPPLHTTTNAASVSAFQQPDDSPIMSQGIRDSPIMSQATGNSHKLTALEKQAGDSPELTATEKITKLKTQWLNQLR